MGIYRFFRTAHFSIKAGRKGSHRSQLHTAHVSICMIESMDENVYAVVAPWEVKGRGKVQ